MKKLLIIPFIFLHFILQAQTVKFFAPDTVCTGDPINLTNESSGSNTCKWVYDAINLSKVSSYDTLLGVSLRENGAAFIASAVDSGNYYTFITIKTPAAIWRQNYGNSLNNVPINTLVLDLSKIAPDNWIQGIDIKKDVDGIWYGLVSAGIGNGSKIYRLTFEKGLNFAPSLSEVINVGPIDSPHDIKLVYENNIWHAFICSRGSSGANGPGTNIVKFTQGLKNQPGFSDYFYVGPYGINAPTGIAPIKEGNKWYLFVTGSKSLLRIELESISESTAQISAVHLGDLKGTLNGPFDISIAEVCGQLSGIVVNQDNNSATIIDFEDGLSGNIIGTQLNIPLFNKPYSVTDIQRIGSEAFFIVPNYNNGKIVRIKYSEATSSNTSPAVLDQENCTAPSYAYTAPGKYNITLTLNSDISKTTCKTVVVVDKPATPIINNGNICAGKQLKLDNDSAYTSRRYTYFWKGPNGFVSNEKSPIIREEGRYTIIISRGDCFSDSAYRDVLFYIPTPPVPSISDPKMVYCLNQPVNPIQINITGSNIARWYKLDHYTFLLGEGNPYQTGITKLGNYDFYATQVTPEGCESGILKVNVIINPSPKVNILYPKELSCIIATTIVDGTGSSTGDSISYLWSGGNIVSGQEDIKAVVDTGSVYTLKVTNTNTGCSTSGSIRVIQRLQYPESGTALSNVSICSDKTYNLFSSIKDNFSGGVWRELDSKGNITGSNLNPSNLASGNYKFRYVLSAVGSCPGDSVVSTIDITKFPSAGVAKPSQTICNNGNYILTNTLNNFDTNGYWTASFSSIQNKITGNIFDALNVLPGSYNLVYHTNPIAACKTGDTTKVIIKVASFLSAGNAKDTTICSKDSFLLFQAIKNYDNGGVWLDDSNSGRLRGSYFDPNDLLGGYYQFTYQFDSAVCPSSKASVTILTDTITPKINCPGEVIKSLSLGAPFYEVIAKELDPILISDTCGIMFINNDFNNDSSLKNAQISETKEIIWTVSDFGKNIAQCKVKLILNGSQIPNVFTPNGDGVNDSWDFSISGFYPKGIVQIFDRWGNKVWESEEGYPQRWDGKVNGTIVPVGTYRYFVLDEDKAVLKGFLTILGQ